MSKLMSKNCLVCGREFAKSPTCSKTEWERAKYCSHACHSRALRGVAPQCSNKGRVPWNRGLTKERDMRVRKYSEARIGVPHTPKHIEANRIAMLRLWSQPEFVAKVMRARPSEARRISLAQARQVRLERGTPPWNKGKTNCYSDETRRKMGAGIEKTMLALKARPNRAETKLGILVEPFGFRYVGAGQLVVGNRCPDFTDGNRKLIELFGDYWHRGENPKLRQQHFRQHGFDCLVIWEHELLEPDMVQSRVRAFTEVPE